MAPDDAALHPRGERPAPTPIERPFAKADYLATVLKAKEYIVAGDLMQVQIGQVLRKAFMYSPLSLYRALRSINPSPYMYYYDFGDLHVVGASPEILVRQDTAPRPEGDAAPDRRHPPARHDAGATTSGSPRNCWPTPRSAPST